MSIKCEEYGRVCVMEVQGDFIGDAAQRAKVVLDEQIDQRHVTDVVVDVNKAGFIDSEGLETLLWMKRRCEELFGRIKLAGPDENVRKILEITRLDHRFECHPDVAAALKTMR